MSEPILLANEHCDTGENPLWDPAEGCVYWTDIPNGRLFRYDLDAGTHRQIYSGPPVGGFTLHEGGGLLLFRVNDIALLPPGGSARTLVEYTDPGMERFNDVIADPEGRVFAGTIGKTPENGGLYRIDLDGTVTQLFTGTRNSNGTCFSADLLTFFWTDSTAKSIHRFDYDLTSGELSNRAKIYQAGTDEGTPDGMTIDTEGNLLSARWGGGRIVKISPEGEVLGRLDLPVSKVSCPCFGGPDLDILFVTTAGGGREGAVEEDGALYRLDGAGRGRGDFRSRILL